MSSSSSSSKGEKDRKRSTVSSAFGYKWATTEVVDGTSVTKLSIDERYEVTKVIGSGAYGLVCAGQDTKTGAKVAIKKIKRAFTDIVDAKRILRELRLLQQVKHENIIQLIDVMGSPPGKPFEDIYIVTNQMETDLARVVRSKQALMNEHIQYFLYQILRAVLFMHSAGIIHRDLKPGNLLVNQNCDLRICDFGLARGVAAGEKEGAEAAKGDEKELLTEYVVTRWYRAPEVMLSSQEYAKGIDIWAVGCIFAELLGRKTLLPGTDYINQVNQMIDLLGTPDKEDLAFVSNARAKKYIESLPAKPGADLKAKFPNAPPEALDLLKKLLKFNPAKRATAHEALRHPYLAHLHDPSDEPTLDKPFDFEYEK
uniref:Mitogen-activated protein kinase n=1 Tax=Chromera velia CCMP2878 TaxID=1169474 RepID=A0A0G4HI23_9ALVE|eukprot:Cvel_27692.t1-p1 / transcript=Cvel_27692.t1 / gene=Cvel_27692 / organism=Chromera_velia_CCMP2878 / gene_product=Mitogen-activated protein kinase 4, putative / transcript_product=Mitogen-activated protein kinase 4, putative / location=Cvel_scaffold3496:918-5767(-) / protein_length=368 / sequence_SO=supercontig / SO=protein_coding / is_pseudo=false